MKTISQELLNEVTRRLAAEKGLTDEEAFEQGMAEKSKQFVEAGAEVYSSQ